MKILDAAQTAAALPFDRLIPALRDAFVAGAEAPLRHRHDIAQPDGTDAALLLMPAWQARGFVGVKVVSVFPGNGALGLPAVSASYLLCDGDTGRHVALIDGAELTRRRTAAASALAGSFLARDDAASLLIVGSGPYRRHDARGVSRGAADRACPGVEYSRGRARCASRPGCVPKVGRSRRSAISPRQ